MRCAWLAIVVLFGCAGTGQRPAAKSPPPAAPTEETDDEDTAPPPASPGGLPLPAAGVPDPPPRCSAFTITQRPSERCPENPAAWRTALDTALSKTVPEERDATLASLEACPGLPSGLLRALRADLAPEGCADAIVQPALRHSGNALRPDLRDTLVGLGLGARLARLVRAAPRLEPPFDRERFMPFFEDRLTPWIVDQARAIHLTAAQGAHLKGYGQGIVAIQAGLADMRFVEVARDVPLPEDMSDDPEIEDVYYSTLDQALGPRKVRGRDAALVGLKRFAELGVIHDPRLDRARNLLSKLFGGRRVNALDGLMLPEQRPLALDTVETRLAARLPTFYARFVLSEELLADAAVVEALLKRGLFPEARARARDPSLSREATRSYGRALFELGRVYFRAPDFAAAADLFSRIDGEQAVPETRLLATLAQILEQGPRDAAELMLRGPRYPEAIGDVSPLDRLAKRGGPYEGPARFDAAYLLSLVPPLEPNAAFWDDVAQRFERAATRLGGAARKRAAQSAAAARKTASAIREGPGGEEQTLYFGVRRPIQVEYRTFSPGSITMSIRSVPRRLQAPGRHPRRERAPLRMFRCSPCLGAPGIGLRRLPSI